MKIIQENIESEVVDALEIMAADYINSHKIAVKFSDGVYNVVDFKQFLSGSVHPSISKYLDEKLFKQFQIIDGNLNWNDYDLIFPLDELYQGQIK